MLGFLNPVHFGRNKRIDLLPTSEARYRFRLFPLHFGVHEQQAIPQHAALTRLSREISPRQVDVICRHAPLVEVDTVPIDFDEGWYCREYMDAALEISEGWVCDALEHYLEIGMRRGYRPMPAGFTKTRPALREGLVDLALNQPARQSSVSEWSFGASPDEDAGRAVMGIEQIPCAFHTKFEDTPWWEVDLGQRRLIVCIVISNRSEAEVFAGRGSPLCVDVSDDGATWHQAFRTPDALLPGRDGRPLVWTPAAPIIGRYVRVSIPRYSCLHLRQVQVFGSAAIV